MRFCSELGELLVRKNQCGAKGVAKETPNIYFSAYLLLPTQTLTPLPTLTATPTLTPTPDAQHPLLLLPTRLSSAAAMPSTASRSLGGSASSLGRSSATVTSPRSTDRRRAAHCPALQKATCHTHFAASCRTSPPPHVGVRARHGGSCAASSASFFIRHPIAAHARLRGVAHATYLCKSP